jgi:hemolysin-activating ACP:hemolysin acyltransferase
LDVSKLSVGNGVHGAPPTELDRKNAQGLSKLISSSIGEIVVVLSRSQTFKHFAFADIEWMVLPPVFAGQFLVLEAADSVRGFSVPVAAIAWAGVSPDVDQRLTQTAGQPMRLRPDDWTSGEHVWLIYVVGDPRALELGLRACAEGPLKDRTVKMITRTADGRPQIQLLHELIDGRPQTPGDQS